MRHAAPLPRAMLEPLEGRALLAAVSWDAGGGDGLWSNPLNWSGDALPTQVDDVTIDWGANRRTIAADAGVIRVRSLSLSELLIVTRGTTLNVNEAFDIHAAGAIRINGLVNWAEGAWASDDPAVVNPGGVLNIGSSASPGTGAVTLAADLTNLGAVSWRGGDIALGGTLTNELGKLLSVASPGSITGSGHIVNHSLLRKHGATTTIGVPVSSSSRLYALQGTLILGAPGQAGESSVTGRIYAKQGAAIEWRGDAAITGVEFHGTGAVSFLAGSFAFEGTNRLGSATVRFENVHVVATGAGTELVGGLEAIDTAFTLDADLALGKGDWYALPPAAFQVRLIDSTFTGAGRLTLEAASGGQAFCEISGVVLDVDAALDGNISILAVAGSDGRLSIAPGRTVESQANLRIMGGTLAIGDGAVFRNTRDLALRDGGSINGTAGARLENTSRLIVGYLDPTVRTYVLEVTLDSPGTVSTYPGATLDIRGPLVQLTIPSGASLMTLTGGTWTPHTSGPILMPGPIESIGAGAVAWGTLASMPALAHVTQNHGRLAISTEGSVIDLDSALLTNFGSLSFGSHTGAPVVLATPIDLRESGTLDFGGTLEITAFDPSGIFHNRGTINAIGTLVLHLDQAGGEQRFINSGRLDFWSVSTDSQIVVHGDMTNQGWIGGRISSDHHASGLKFIHVDGELTQGGTLEFRFWRTPESYGSGWVSIPVYAAGGVSGEYEEVRLYRMLSTTPTIRFTWTYGDNGVEMRPIV